MQDTKYRIVEQHLVSCILYLNLYQYQFVAKSWYLVYKLPRNVAV